jgi:hypothetical protein
MKHAETVPFHWFERNPRNPWYDRETRQVQLPDTLTHKNNYVLTREELAQLGTLVIELKKLVEKEATTAQRAARALEKGLEPLWIYNDDGPPVFTLCHLLEFVNKMKQWELDLTKLLLVTTKRRVDALPGREPNAS